VETGDTVISVDERSGAMTQRWDRHLSTGKVARALGLSNSTVQAYAREGVVPASTTPGGQYRFNLDEVRQALSGDPLPAQELPSLDDGPAVLVSLRSETPGDERARAYAELRGVVAHTPAGAHVDDESADDDFSLDGLVQRAPAAVTAYLQLR
jgi:excisionase family DNA binding protein